MKKQYWIAILCVALALVLTIATASADAGDEYRLLTDVSELHDGDQIILVSDNDEYYQAMATDFSGVQVIVMNSSITEQNGMLVLRLEITEGGWYLSNERGYLTANGNTLAFANGPSDDTLWSISIASDGTASIYCAEGDLIFAEEDGAYRFSCGEGGNEVNVYRNNVTVESEQHPFGEGLWWSFLDGKLTIGGSGDIPNFTSASDQPWASIRDIITGVEIQEEVTSVGSSAFENCTGLTLVMLSDKTTSINKGAFYGCIMLTSVTIPDNVISIGNAAFENCTGLTSITIPDSVTSIGGGAFCGCTSLDEIIISDKLTQIGEVAFANTAYWNTQNDGIVYLSSYLLGYKGTCTQQILSIKPGTRVIADYALYGCSSLLTIRLASTLEHIGKNAFGKCTGLKSITIPNSMTSIGYGAFIQCTNLASVTIPDSVIKIEDYAFWTTGLTEIVIPDSVTEIGGWAFANCTNLTSITLPCSARIGRVAFAGSSAETMSICLTKGNGTMLSYTIDSNAENSYQNTPWYSYRLKTLAVTIDEGVENVGDYAFCHCTGLTTVTIPDSVTSIGDSAFSSCTGLTEVTIGSGVTSIGKSAFYDCTGLTTVTIPDSVTSIGDSAFSYCSELSSVTIPDSVRSINQYAFRDCTGLTSITIGNDVIKCGRDAFLNTGWWNAQSDELIYLDYILLGWKGSCSQTIEISADTRLIADDAFYTNSQITAVTIPDSVTHIGIYAFYRCTRLLDVYYLGTIEQRAEILIENWNDSLLDATWHCSDGLLTNVVAYTDHLLVAKDENGANIVRAQETNLGDLCADAYRYMFDSDIAFVNGGGVRANIEIGDITLQQIRNVHPFGNTAVLAEVTGQQILDALEMGSRVYPSLNGGFLQVAGLKYEIHSYVEPNCVVSSDKMWQGPVDPALPYRVRNVQVMNKESGEYEPLDLEKTYTLAGHNYMLIDMGDGLAMFGANITILNDSGIADNQVLINYIRSMPENEDGKHVVTGYTDPRGEGRITIVSETPAEPMQGQCGDNLYWSFDEETGTLTITGSGDMWDFIFTSNSTSAPWDSFRNKIISVSISDGVTSIGNAAFYCYTVLSTISFGSSVTRIGEAAFAGCLGLTGIAIPDSVIMLEKSAFGGCENLRSAVIGKGVTCIGEYAFSLCTVLEEITIPDGVTEIGEAAFVGCAFYHVNIPNSVVSIGRLAFGGCRGLESITIGNGVTSIDRNAFDNCTALADVYYLGTESYCNEHLLISGNNNALLNAIWHYLTPVSIEMKTLPDRLIYVEGEELVVNGGKILVYYEYDITAEIVLTDEMVSGFDNTVVGTQTLMVTFEGHTTTFDVTVIAPPAFKTQSLTLEGKIGVDFFVDLPQDDAIEYEGVAFTIDSIDGADAFVPFGGTDHPKNGSGYYKFTYYVRTIEMANTITATLRYTLNGEAMTLEKTYSVKQYFDTFDQYISLFSEKQQNMTKATADLGHYIQAFLAAQKGWTFGTDYAEMDKHYADYTADDISAAQTALTAYAPDKSLGTNMQKITYSLALDSDTELLVYFKPAKSYTGTFTFTVNGDAIAEDGEKISVKLQSDGRYLVSIKNIGAHELSNMYRIVAQSAGSEAYIELSTLSYANAMMTAYEGNATALNAAVAIYRYAMAANALIN